MEMSKHEIVEPSDLTIDFLFDLFDAAYMKVDRTEVGVIILDDRRVFVDPISNGRSIWFVATYSFRESATQLEKLEYVNLVNADLAMIRAYASGENTKNLSLDYTFSVDGGVSKRSVVYAVRRFISVVNIALNKDINNIIE